MYLDIVLKIVLEYGGERRIVFSCFHPDICTMYVQLSQTIKCNEKIIYKINFRIRLKQVKNNLFTKKSVFTVIYSLYTYVSCVLNGDSFKSSRSFRHCVKV